MFNSITFDQATANQVADKQAELVGCFAVQSDSPLLPAWARLKTKTKTAKTTDENGNVVTFVETTNQDIELTSLVERSKRRLLAKTNREAERRILAESKQARLAQHAERIVTESEFDDDLAADIHHGNRDFAYAEFAKLIGME